MLQTTVHSDYELEDAVKELCASVPQWERPFCELFSKYISADEFPLAECYSFLTEEFIDSAISQHAVEGWTDSDGIHHVWALLDNNYWPGKCAPLNYNSVPTRLSPAEVGAVVQVVLETISAFDMRSGFWNVEVWILSDGRIQSTEVNGRICASMTTLYRAVYSKTQYAAAVKIARGLPVDMEADIPQEATGVGAMVALTTAKKGYVRGLIKLDDLESLSGLKGVLKTTLMYSPDTLITWH